DVRYQRDDGDVRAARWPVPRRPDVVRGVRGLSLRDHPSAQLAARRRVRPDGVARRPRRPHHVRAAVRAGDGAHLMAAMSGRFADRVAIVTGGTTGIGAAIVERLVAEGAAVVMCARHEPEQPIAGDVTFAAADVTRDGDMERVVDAT